MSDGYLYKFGGEMPKMPYRKGKHLTLSSHIAPEPFECSIYLTEEDDRELRYQHPLEIARNRPPKEGPISKHNYDITVEITDKIRVAAKRNAQLVKVKVLRASQNAPTKIQPGIELVAKIYDPLHNHHGDWAHDHYIYADMQYAQEVAVYQRLVNLQGEVIPAFYGGFSVDIDTPFDEAMMGEMLELTRLPPSVVKRRVRCVMIQYIEGTTLIDIPQDIPDTTCKAMMKAILDSEAQVYLYNVRLRDFHPRNIILVENQHKFKAVLIDFADADLARCTDERLLKRFDFFDGKFISPLLRYDINNTGHEYPGGEELAPWIKFDWQHWLEHTYSSDIVDLDPDELAGMRRTFT